MARTRILLSLDPETYEELKREAARLRTLPATLAAELLARSLTGEERTESVERPSVALKAWLEPHLDRIRETGGWPPDITVGIFDLIRDQAGELYQAAVEEVGPDLLNRELGRMIKERLGARVLKRDGQPQRIKVSRKLGSLIKLATLLEPAGDRTGS